MYKSNAIDGWADTANFQVATNPKFTPIVTFRRGCTGNNKEIVDKHNSGQEASRLLDTNDIKFVDVTLLHNEKSPGGE